MAPSPFLSSQIDKICFLRDVEILLPGLEQERKAFYSVKVKTEQYWKQAPIVDGRYCVSTKIIVPDRNAHICTCAESTLLASVGLAVDVKEITVLNTTKEECSFPS